LPAERDLYGVQSPQSLCSAVAAAVRWTGYLAGYYQPDCLRLIF